ncbi:unnamed protein product [Staurois parvus]|uniref:Uncharacterized protein n=1 Tax=Staurois parvus TaxID=386267 RepID=A0ABN9GFU7_9NEOB|nr:unnamed protein product [Staurois parvus]
MWGPRRPDIADVGSEESRYSECRGPRRPDIVDVGSEETRYSGCRVRGEQI